eukprot:SAG31_NODE_2157_length_6308_cov_4.823482_3_plen_627_part_00
MLVADSCPSCALVTTEIAHICAAEAKDARKAKEALAVRAIALSRENSAKMQAVEKSHRAQTSALLKQFQRSQDHVHAQWALTEAQLDEAVAATVSMSQIVKKAAASGTTEAEAPSKVHAVTQPAAQRQRQAEIDTRSAVERECQGRNERFIRLAITRFDRQRRMRELMQGFDAFVCNRRLCRRRERDNRVLRRLHRYRLAHSFDRWAASARLTVQGSCHCGLAMELTSGKFDTERSNATSSDAAASAKAEAARVAALLAVHEENRERQRAELRSEFETKFNEREQVLVAETAIWRREHERAVTAQIAMLHQKHASETRQACQQRHDPEADVDTNIEVNAASESSLRVVDNDDVVQDSATAVDSLRSNSQTVLTHLEVEQTLLSDVDRVAFQEHDSILEKVWGKVMTSGSPNGPAEQPMIGNRVQVVHDYVPNHGAKGKRKLTKGEILEVVSMAGEWLCGRASHDSHGAGCTVVESPGWFPTAFVKLLPSPDPLKTSSTAPQQEAGQSDQSHIGLYRLLLPGGKGAREKIGLEMTVDKERGRVTVAAVTPVSPASGVEVGDVVVEVAGVMVENSEAAKHGLAAMNAAIDDACDGLRAIQWVLRREPRPSTELSQPRPKKEWWTMQLA